MRQEQIERVLAVSSTRVRHFFLASVPKYSNHLLLTMLEDQDAPTVVGTPVEPSQRFYFCQIQEHLFVSYFAK
jgi:hypothetical protein